MNEFIKQLNLKRELLLKVLDLTRSQTELIKNDDTNALLTNISERQQLIDQLDAIQADLPDKETLKSNDECLQIIATVNNILNLIQEQDAANEKTALERMDYYRDQMRKVGDGRKTLIGYESSKGVPMQGNFINRIK